MPFLPKTDMIPRPCALYRTNTYDLAGGCMPPYPHYHLSEAVPLLYVLPTQSFPIWGEVRNRPTVLDCAAKIQKKSKIFIHLLVVLIFFVYLPHQIYTIMSKVTFSKNHNISRYGTPWGNLWWRRIERGIPNPAFFITKSIQLCKN